MICGDCSRAADAIGELGVTAVTVGQQIDAIVLDDMSTKALNFVLSGHRRCWERQALATVNLQIETGRGTIRSAGCTCQHRPATIPLTRQ